MVNNINYPFLYQINIIVNKLESLISEIKKKGFDKYKSQIDESEKIKKILEVRIENYQKILNLRKSESKYCGEKNTRVECDSDLYKKYTEVNFLLFYLFKKY
jgi:hypothetical protein